MKTQAWGWLVAGIVALGLNGFYQDGGFAWAHRAVFDVEHNVGAVLALASGRADQFVAEVQPVVARQETASCRLATTLARVQTRVARVQTQLAQSQSGWDRFEAASEAMSARQEAAAARWEASRARIEARVSRMHVPAANFDPVVFTDSRACPRIRVNIPQAPMIKMPALPAGPV